MHTDEHRFKPKVLDCFSGIGGFSLAFEGEGFRTAAFVECDENKRIVLRHWWPGIPIFPDVRDSEGIRRFCESVGGIDVLTGGVPCQPASALGQMRGSADERWLWPDAIRLVREVRPRFAVFENPPSILVLEGGRAWNGIVSRLVALGYDLWWDIFPAAAFGAGHLRERVVLVASHAPRERGADAPDGLDSKRACGDARPEFAGGCLPIIADTKSKCERKQKNEAVPGGGSGEAWAATSSLGDSANVTHANGAGLEGHAGNGDAIGNGGGQSEKTERPIAPPDLRGRVFATERGEPQWWHETHTGIPVLAHGLPTKLVEAAARCTGDAVVPQVVQPIARAIRKIIL